MNSTSNNLIIGETCLLGYQLRRLGMVDGPIGMFENMLVNLDGIKLLIEDDFEFLLFDPFLKYEYFIYYPEHGIGYNKWINNKYTSDIDNIFSWPVFSYFHHDTLDQTQRESISRKINRFKNSLIGEDNINLFYYYRSSSRFNLEIFLKKAEIFLLFLKEKYKKPFHMHLITKRELVESNIDVYPHSNITHYEFSSPFSWIDIDDNWNGSSDNNLFDTFKINYEKIICNINSK